jgi:putative membrane protein
MSTVKIHTAILYALAASAVLCSTAEAQAPGTTRSPVTSTDTPRSGMDKKDHAGMTKEQGAPMSVDSKSFATQAANTDMAEIELARLAMKNSDDSEVKKFAEQMVKDHTATSTKLKSLAAKENITLPTALDAEHAAVKTKLAALKGKDFDKAYGMEMAKGHDKAVALFESASQAPAVTGDLKQFATATLPKLKEHKGMAHDLHGQEGA